LSQTDYQYTGSPAPNSVTITQATLDDPATPDVNEGDSPDLVTRTGFDAYGNVNETWTGDDTRKVSIEYDPVYHTFPATVTYPDNSEETYQYDARFGLPNVITDVNRLATGYIYNQFGRVKTVDGVNGHIAYNYSDEDGQPATGLIVTRAYAGADNTFDTSDDFNIVESYDGLGQLVRTVTPGGSEGDGTLTTAYTYGYQGRRVGTSVPSLETGQPVRMLQTIYDALGRLTSVDSLDGTTGYTYDNGWQTVEITDAAGQTKTYTLDAFGHVTEVKEAIKGPEDNQIRIETTAYEYNTLGQLRKITDAGGNETEMWYDSLGRKVQMKDPDMGTWHYTYNQYGEPATQTDARGVKTTFNYDNLGRLLTKIYDTSAAPKVAETGKVTYIYNDLKTTMYDGSGHTTWTYDQAGRLKIEAKAITGYPDSFITLYNYNGLGQLETMTYPDGEKVTYGYNQAGQVTQATGNNHYLTGAAYNPLGQIKNLPLHSGAIQQAFTYYPDSFRPHTASATANGNDLQNLEFSFDDLGRPKTFDDSLHTLNLDYTNGYDSLNRLIDVTGSYVQHYKYDDIGNLTKRDNFGFDYAALNSLPHAPGKITSPDGPAIDLTYDDNGNLKDKSAGVSYTYDAENRLTRVISDTATSTLTTTFTYDGEGQLVKRSAPDGLNRYYIGDFYETGDSPVIANDVYSSSDLTKKVTSAAAVEGRLYAAWGSSLLFNPLRYTKNVNGSWQFPSLAKDNESFYDIALATYKNSNNADVLNLVWVDSSFDLRLTRSEDGGETWSMRSGSLSKDPANQQSRQPVLAANGQNLYLAWTESALLENNCSGCYHIFYRFSSDGGQNWDDPITRVSTLFTGPYSSAQPDIAVTGSNVAIAWRFDNTSARGLTTAGSIYIRRQVGITAELISANEGLASWPKIAAGGDDTLHVIWNYNDEIHYRYWNGSAWSAIQSISGTAGARDNDSGFHEIAVDNHGQVYVAWQAANRDTVMTRRNSDNTWTEPEVLASAFNGSELSLVFDAANAPHVIQRKGSNLYDLSNLKPPVKRYFADGRQLATRIDGDLYYTLLDPTGTSLTMVDDSGVEAGHLLYDAYGGVLTSTLPVTLTGSLGNLPDPATGLVHLGNGRWFDPALGRPLQPNPVGGVPMVPQSLNRYSATSLGQPGVAEAAVQSTFGTRLLQAAGNSLVVNSINEAASLYANHYVYLYAHINRVDIQGKYPRLFGRTTNSLGEVQSRIPVKPLGNGRFALPWQKEPINLREFDTLKRRGKNLRIYFSASDNAFKRLLRSSGEATPGLLLDLALAGPELLAPWQNPYFNTEQRFVQNVATLGGVAAGTGVGAWVGSAATTAGLGGPATFAVVTVSGVVVFATWEGIIKPAVSWTFTSFGRPDPYQEYRNLKPLVGGQ
jgi:YD repeat-containing protein